MDEMIKMEQERGEMGWNFVVRMLLILLIILAPIFISAGTLNWPEAWLYILISFCYFIPALLYLRKHSPELLKRRSQLEVEKGWDVVVIIATSIFLIASFVIMGLDAVRFGWSAVPVELKALGFVGIILSYVLLFLVFKENPYAFRAVKVEKDQELITTGPYSVVRHPLYVAVIIQFSCLPLALGSFYALVPAILFDIFVIIRTALEDRTLLEELRGYKEYATRVRYRLLPSVW